MQSTDAGAVRGAPSVRRRLPPVPEPRLVDSIVRVVEAGQHLVVDRIDLARLDLAQAAARAVRGAALLVIGTVLIAGAWGAAMGAAVVWLHAYLSLAASLAVVGAASAGCGAIALAIGVRRAGPDVLSGRVQEGGPR